MDNPASFHAEVDGQTLRDCLAQVPSCVVAVTATVERRPVVMVASSFVGISLDPPMVGFFPQVTSATWPLIKGANSIGVSVLAEQHTTDARAMAARYGDRLAGVDTFVDASGTLYIAGSAAWLRTTLVSETLLGDHLLAALAVHSLKVGPGAPLVFHESAFKGCAALGAETSS